MLLSHSHVEKQKQQISQLSSYIFEFEVQLFKVAVNPFFLFFKSPGEQTPVKPKALRE